MKIALLIDDDPIIAKIISHALKEDFEVLYADSVKSAKENLDRIRPNVILLDINLPDGDGMRFGHSIISSEIFSDIPLLFITGNCDVSDKVMGFSLGAADYITKPFDSSELRARVLARVRSQEKDQEKSNKIILGNLELQLSTQKIFLNLESKKELEMTSLDFKILLHFARHPDQVLTRNQLISAIWGEEVAITERTIDQHISRIRKQLHGSDYSIKSIYGSGYKFSKED